jgi:hypothetical protein
VRSPLKVLQMGQTQTRKQKILGDVKKSRRQRLIISTVIITVLAVSIVAGIIFLTPHAPPNPLIGTPISTTMYDQLTGVNDSTLQAVGAGSQPTAYLQPESGTLLTSGNKPEVLYMGGDFCPYCAAERWSIIVALSKFGTWKPGSILFMISSDTDQPASVPTFSFSSIGTDGYSSNYISFVAVELYNRDRANYQTPTQQETNLMSQYDPSTGIPFLDIANQYVLNSGSQYSPTDLSGNWTQIGSQLNTPNTAMAKAVDGAADYLISAICKIDNGNPSSICNQTFAGLTQAPIGATNLPPASNFNMIAIGVIRSDDLSWRSFQRLIS